MKRSTSDKIGDAPKVAGLRVSDHLYPEPNPGAVVHMIIVFDGNWQVAVKDLIPFEYFAE
jgi:hypothetical protein